MHAWENSADCLSAHLVRETPHGIFRAVVETDLDASAPEDDGGCPVLRIDWNGYRYRATHETYGHPADDVADALNGLLDRLGRDAGLAAWRRWLAIYRAGAATEEHASSVHRGSDLWVAYLTGELREEWGIPADVAPNITEWMAYVDGEVYGIRVERADSFDEDGDPDTWSEVDDSAVWGFYGEEYAKQAAAELLTETVADLAADMLPTGE